MIMLREHFDSDRCTFLLLKREMTITLEDVYRIFQVLLEGEQVTMATDKAVI